MRLVRSPFARAVVLDGLVIVLATPVVVFACQSGLAPP
jgi:hypothetical protein